MVLWFLKCLHQCKCKNKSNRRTTSQLLNGLSPGNFKGNVSVYYRSTGVLKRGGQPLLIHCGLELPAYSKIMLCERCYGW